MTWRSEVVEKSKNESNGNIVVRVAYTSDKGQTAAQTLQAYDLTNERIAQHCQNYCIVLEARDNAYDDIVIGPVTLPRDKTPEEQAAAEKVAQTDKARQNLGAAASKVAALKTLVDAGVLEVDDPVYRSAKEDAKAVTDVLLVAVQDSSALAEVAIAKG